MPRKRIKMAVKRSAKKSRGRRLYAGGAVAASRLLHSLARNPAVRKAAGMAARTGAEKLKNIVVDKLSPKQKEAFDRLNDVINNEQSTTDPQGVLNDLVSEITGVDLKTQSLPKVDSSTPTVDGKKRTSTVLGKKIKQVGRPIRGTLGKTYSTETLIKSPYTSMMKKCIRKNGITSVLLRDDKNSILLDRGNSFTGIADTNYKVRQTYCEAGLNQKVWWMPETDSTTAASKIGARTTLETNGFYDQAKISYASCGTSGFIGMDFFAAGRSLYNTYRSLTNTAATAFGANASDRIENASWVYPFVERTLTSEIQNRSDTVTLKVCVYVLQNKFQNTKSALHDFYSTQNSTTNLGFGDMLGTASTWQSKIYTPLTASCYDTTGTVLAGSTFRTGLPTHPSFQPTESEYFNSKYSVVALKKFNLKPGDVMFHKLRVQMGSGLDIVSFNNHIPTRDLFGQTDFTSEAYSSYLKNDYQVLISFKASEPMLTGFKKYDSVTFTSTYPDSMSKYLLPPFQASVNNTVSFKVAVEDYHEQKQVFGWRSINQIVTNSDISGQSIGALGPRESFFDTFLVSKKRRSYAPVFNVPANLVVDLQDAAATTQTGYYVATPTNTVIRSIGTITDPN